MLFYLEAFHFHSRGPVAKNSCSLQKYTPQSSPFEGFWDLMSRTYGGIFARDCSPVVQLSSIFLYNDKVLEGPCNKCRPVIIPYMAHVLILIAQTCSMHFPICCLHPCRWAPKSMPASAARFILHTPSKSCYWADVENPQPWRLNGIIGDRILAMFIFGLSLKFKAMKREPVLDMHNLSWKVRRVLAVWFMFFFKHNYYWYNSHRQN